MPPTRDDKRLLIVVGTFLALAAVLFGGVIFLATQREAADENDPLFLGQRKGLVDSILEASPLYFASPFGDQDGFWLDVVGDRELVAYVLDRPDPGYCAVKWREPRDAYVDCDDQDIDPLDLDRYVLEIGSRDGSPSTAVYVDLRKKIPAPGST